jgi:hypothetical protein
MYIFHLFRSFLPNLNPIGFSASDFIEIVVTVVLVVLALAWRRWIEPYGRRLAQKTAGHGASGPAPDRAAAGAASAISNSAPNVSDDFSYLLIADTLRHFRLANPAHIRCTSSSKRSSCCSSPRTPRFFRSAKA